MKAIAFFLSLFIVVAFSSCERQSANRIVPEGDLGLYITGVSQSLTYTFTSGRLSETPDDVRELYVLILDEGNNIVYEQWYWNQNYWLSQDSTLTNGDIYYFENTIPDTLFIPPLPAGNYDILASTTYLNYHGESTMNPDGTWTEGPMIYPRIEPYNVSENPIYVGKSTVNLSEDNQGVVLNMRNISAKITIAREDTTNIEGGNLNLIFRTKNNKYFSFANDAIANSPYNYDHYLFTYLYSQERKKNFYVLPTTLTGVEIEYVNNYLEQYNFRIEIPIDPDIDIKTDDAIAFLVNLDNLLSGASSGTVLWKELTWNSLGEISIP